MIVIYCFCWQLVGYSAEILDLVYVGEGDTHLAVASNSCDIKLYELETMNCQLLGGHTDFVMALTTTHINRHLFASSSKVRNLLNSFYKKIIKKKNSFRTTV